MNASLRTERLVVRIASADDAGELAAYFARNDARFAPWGEARSHAAEAYRAWFGDAHARGDARLFLASLPAATSIVAIVTLAQFDLERPGNAELSYTVDGAYEGRGYASEAVAAVVAHAHDAEGRTTLSARFEPENVRSGALLARSGFAEIARTAVIPGFERLMRAQIVVARSLV